MTKYVLTSIIDKDSKDAGPKAKNDIAYFLQKKGYQPLDLNLPTKRSAKIKYVLFELKKVFKNLNASEIVFQYPIYSMFLTQRIIKTLKKTTQAKIYFVIHDVEALRDQKNNPKFIQAEQALFQQVDGLIVHNENMKTYLQKQGIKTLMVELSLFDYLNEQPLNEDFTYQKTLCYAGNLQKAAFLTKLKLTNTSCFVFGNNQAKTYPTGIFYQGSYSPDELPKYLKQDFGLIWDGDSLTTGAGVFGEYTKYNAPHKTSLYLSSGLPVIVWQKAGVAQFVKKNQVGLVVDNLTDLEEVLQNVSSKQYQLLKKNVLRVAQKLRTGGFIEEALAKLNK